MKCHGKSNQRGQNIISAILDTLTSICRITNLNYCYPSQSTILKKLSIYHQIEMSRRSLNYYLKYMEASGMIKRVRRISKDKKSGILKFRSTMYWVTTVALNCVKKLINTATRIYKSIRVQKVAHHIFTTERVFTKVDNKDTTSDVSSPSLTPYSYIPDFKSFIKSLG